MLSTSSEKRCCLKFASCVEGIVYAVSCRCGQVYYLCPNHCEKVVKEAMASHSKVLNRKGDVSRTPLEKICNIGHKNLNEIVMLMAASTTAFSPTGCTGKLQVSDKISTVSKVNKARAAPTTKTLLVAGSEVGASSHALSATAAEQHPNFKTDMCRYGDRCIYGDRCSFAHNEAELRTRPYMLNTTNPAVADPNAAVLSSVSVGPAAGATVVVSSIVKPMSNESFKMQNDDFPGLPGAAPRAAAAAATGVTQSPSLAPVSNGHYNNAAAIKNNGSFDFSEMNKSIYGVGKPAPIIDNNSYDRNGDGIGPVMMYSQAEQRMPSAAPRNNGAPAASSASLLQSTGLSPSYGYPGTAQQQPLQQQYNGINGASRLSDHTTRSIAPGYGVDIPSSSVLGVAGSFGLRSWGFLGGSGYYDATSTNPSGIAEGARSEFSQSNFYGGMMTQAPRYEVPPGMAQQPPGMAQQQFYMSTQQRSQQLAFPQSIGVSGQAGSVPAVRNSAPLESAGPHQVQPQTSLPPPVIPNQTASFLPPKADGIDDDLVPLNTFPIVDWLRSSDMGMFKWSGNDRAWTEFAMHVPDRFHSFFTSNLLTWQQHSNCRMRFDNDILRGEKHNFLVLYRGEQGEETNLAMQKGLEIISHHLSFILKNDSKISEPAAGSFGQGWR